MKTNKLNLLERQVYNACLELAKDGDTGIEFCFDELRVTGFSTAMLKGFISQLYQKGFIGKIEDGYFDFYIINNKQDENN